MGMELGNAVFGNSRGQFPVPRYNGYEKILYNLFAALDCGHEGTDFENDTFSMMFYWWGDCTCDMEENEYHKDSCKLVLPNFYYKPTDFKLSWYKYPLRDTYSNREVDLAEFETMIDRCVESLT